VIDGGLSNTRKVDGHFEATINVGSWVQNEVTTITQESYRALKTKKERNYRKGGN